MPPLPTAVICTPLDLEHRAVLDLLDPRHLTEETRDGTVYTLTETEGRHCRWQLAVTLTNRLNEDTSAAVERAIATWSPRLVLLVGVAGGLREAAVGDVVAATKVYGYDSGQDSDTGFAPRIEAIRTSHALDQQAHQVSREATWIERAEPGTTAPRVFHRPIASGGKVVTGSASTTAALIRTQCSDAYAVDMEGFGTMAAAWRNPSVQATVIRGVSDLLDGKTKAADRTRQPMAARRAAAFALALIERSEPAATSTPAPPAETTTYAGTIGSGSTANIGAMGNGAHGHITINNQGRQ